jgi:sugar-specific transcriptional regulator TrmB
MAIHEKYVQALTDLGLTHTQAKVYVALLQLKKANARKLQNLTDIARQDVYITLSELRGKDLVEKVIAKPTQYIPVPPKEAISILLQKRKKMIQQQAEEATQTFSSFKDESVETPLTTGVSQFILLSKSETSPTGHIDKPGKTIDSAKESVMGLITFELFMKIKRMDGHIWKKAVKRGVKFKFIISGRSHEKARLSLDPVLKNADYFEIRWIPEPLQAAVLLVDEKEAFCRTGVTVENPVLWSADPNFVAMIKDYFKTKWKALD